MYRSPAMWPISSFKVRWVPPSNSGRTWVTPATQENSIDLRVVMNLRFDSD